MIAHKGASDRSESIFDRSETFMSAHNEHFFAIFSIALTLMFGAIEQIEEKKGYPLGV
jgi:hypothetical protein